MICNNVAAMQNILRIVSISAMPVIDSGNTRALIWQKYISYIYKWTNLLVIKQFST